MNEKKPKEEPSGWLYAAVGLFLLALMGMAGDWPQWLSVGALLCSALAVGMLIWGEWKKNGKVKELPPEQQEKLRAEKERAERAAAKAQADRVLKDFWWCVCVAVLLALLAGIVYLGENCPWVLALAALLGIVWFVKDRIE